MQVSNKRMLVFKLASLGEDTTHGSNEVTETTLIGRQPHIERYSSMCCVLLFGLHISNDYTFRSSFTSVREGVINPCMFRGNRTNP